MNRRDLGKYLGLQESKPGLPALVAAWRAAAILYQRLAARRPNIILVKRHG